MNHAVPQHAATGVSKPETTVLYLLDYTELGGGETSFLAFVDELRRAAPRVRPVVVVPGPGAVADRLAELGVETRIIAYPRFLRRGPLPWFSLAAARRLGALMDEARPRWVHANNFFGMFYAGPGARRRGIPLIWTCHGWFDIDTRIKAWAARRFAARVSCVSEAVRCEAESRLGGRPPTTTDYLGILPFDEHVENGGELRAAVRAEFGVAQDVPLVAVVGRFQPIKGHGVLLDALPEIRNRVPDLQVWLIGEAQAGDAGEAAHQGLIKRRVLDEGLSHCVRFLGFRRDARRLLRGVDALVIPSLRESFSMAAVEGLEAGIPIVGPDGWGPKEIIEAPRTGLLFKPGDAADLAQRIIEGLLKIGAGADFDALAGPARVKEWFSVEAHVRRTLAIYDGLLAEGT